LLFSVLSINGSHADTTAELNPVLQDPTAVEAGKSLYRRICIICHLKAGGRGPNLFRNKLSHKKFLRTVLQGRAGTQMPSFGERLSVDEVWQIYAFVMSRDRY
jgi:mono/diheme cytochrome c family protein